MKVSTDWSNSWRFAEGVKKETIVIPEWAVQQLQQAGLEAIVPYKQENTLKNTLYSNHDNTSDPEYQKCLFTQCSHDVCSKILSYV